MLQLSFEYDPFLKNHLEEYVSKGNGNPLYISKTNFNKIILVLKADILYFIIDVIKNVNIIR